MTNEQLDYIRQLHENWLTELEGLAIEAIASNDWDKFYAHVVSFQNEHDLHGESLIDIGDDEQTHRYKSGQLVRSIINGNIYRVKNPTPEVHELHLIQFPDGRKVQCSIPTIYSPEQDQYLELYQENA